jgi:Rubisco LSMT substrate-binding
VTAERSYDAREAIVISYGLKSSAQCLEDHGCIPDIPLEDSSCELVVEIDGSERFVDDKLDILERNGYKRKNQFDLEADVETGIDPALIQILRLKLIEGTDAFILESCFSSTVFSTLSMPFSKANELKVFSWLESKCTQLLADLEKVSSSDQDAAILAKSPASTSRAVLLAKLRVQERAALKGTLARIDGELKSMKGADPREYYQERRLRELDLLRPLDEGEVVLD